MNPRARQIRYIERLSAQERLIQPDPADWLKEHGMAEDKAEASGPDRQRINLDVGNELRDWIQSLGVTEEELRKAVAAVGDQADKVRDHLGKN